MGRNFIKKMQTKQLVERQAESETAGQNALDEMGGPGLELGFSSNKSNKKEIIQKSLVGSPAQIIQTQHILGNQAVLRLLGKPGPKSSTGPEAPKTIQRAKTKGKAKLRRSATSAWVLRLMTQGGLNKQDAEALAQAFAGNDSGVSIITVEGFTGLLAGGWNAPSVIGLIKLFNADKGGRTMAEWSGLALAHANIHNNFADVAALIRLYNWNVVDITLLMAAGWTSAALRQFVAQSTAANVTGVQLAALFGSAGFGAASQPLVAAGWSGTNLGAMITAGWTPANLSLFLADAQAAGVSVINLVALLKAVGFGTSSNALVAAGWSTVQLSQFIAAAQVAGLAGNNLQALLGTAGFVGAVTPMVAANWTHTHLGTFSAQMIQATVTAAQLVTIFGTPNFGAASEALFAAGWTGANLASLITANWTPVNLATFVARVHQDGATAASFYTLLTTGGFPASGQALILAGWNATQLGNFISASLLTNVAPATLQTLLATGGFAAAGVDMITATWTHTNLGTFLATALNDGMAALDLNTLLRTAGYPAASNRMKTAGWLPIPMGQFFSQVQQAGTGAAALQPLLNIPNFAISSFNMTANGWTATQLGVFVAATLQTGLTAVNFETTLAAGGFGANSSTWLGLGWTPTQLGNFVGRARLQNLTAPNLTTFMGTANAAANGAALIPAWGDGEVGTTVGHALTRAGQPTEAELVRILEFSNTYNWQAQWVKNATTAATCGAPVWANVNLHAPTFGNVWVGPNGAGGMGGGLVATNTANHFGGGVNYRVKLDLFQGRVYHVENGHSFENFEMTYANCVRNGVGGNITFYAAGTNIQAHVIGAHGAAGGLANTAAWNGFSQANIGGDRVGVAPNGGPYGGGPHGQIYPTSLTQLYPLGGTQIVGRNLVAIGRLMGRF